MRRTSLVVCLFLPLLALQSVTAQATAVASPPAAELQRAATLFAASDWTAANAAYTALASRYPAHPLSRFRTGVTLTELGRPAEGEPMLRAAERLGIPAAQAAYRLAESLAEQRKPDASIAELERSLARGMFLTSQVLVANKHLASLKAHAKWSAVLVAYDQVTQPCRVDPRFREFDFWVGDWDVQPTSGPPSPQPSRNRITLEENGCVVQEHWSGQGGSSGQSFNIFDRSIGRWRQTWVDNSGGQHDYVGELKGGNMVFEGTTPAPRGELGRVPTKLTLFHVGADTVRQFSETSNDGGKSWQLSYDLTYVRRAP